LYFTHLIDYSVCISISSICILYVFRVHIRIKDKLIDEAQLHTLDEYMIHVENYYKQKELSGEVNQKRIYLATNEPTLFDEAKRKYVN